MLKRCMMEHLGWPEGGKIGRALSSICTRRNSSLADGGEGWPGSNGVRVGLCEGVSASYVMIVGMKPCSSIPRVVTCTKQKSEVVLKSMLDDALWLKDAG